MRRGRREHTHLLGLVLDADELIILPIDHGLLHVALHVSGDLGLEVGGLEEGADEAVNSSLEVAIDEQNGGFPHQFREGFWIPRHEGPRIALQDTPTDLCVGRHDRRAAEQMRPEHLPVPVHRQSRESKRTCDDDQIKPLHIKSQDGATDAASRPPCGGSVAEANRASRANN